MTALKMPEVVYMKIDSIVVFRQLGIKIPMDTIKRADYFVWLDRMSSTIGSLVSGAQIVEKTEARVAPPLNTAIYYDSRDYGILPTGALLRTSCNRITHAFCAFKDSQSPDGVRKDHRFVFEGKEKKLIQDAPSSEAAVAVVKHLLCRKDIVQPGTYLERALGIRAEDLSPAICLDDLRYTFFVWLDGRDALRCSLDQFDVSDLRLPEGERTTRRLAEIEISIYPRIDDIVAGDPRTIELINVLQESLFREFGARVTREIKYQRSASALMLSCVAHNSETG
jgi:hypothetical protein